MAFKEPSKWCDWLPAAEWWYNTSYHTSLRTTPFAALYGYAPPQLHAISIPCDASPKIEVTLQQHEHMIKHLQTNLQQTHNHMKASELSVHLMLVP